MNKKLTAFITAAALSAAIIPLHSRTAFTSGSETASDARQMEYLDRGAVAVKVSDGVYLSWRLLGTENYNTSFDVYRGKTYVATVSSSTNYTDTSGSESDTYTVVKKSEDVSAGKSVSVWGTSCLTIDIEPPTYSCTFDGTDYDFTYSANDASCADLDGDGEYEIILKWDPSGSFDSGSAHSGPSGNVFIDAYKLDGTRLWRMDLGVNIPAGAHFTQIAAYDFDLDGYGEVAFKTAPGSKDGNGAYVSEASSVAAIKNTTQNETDYRNSEGRVIEGDEYYTVFDGETGAALDTIYYPHPIYEDDGSGGIWGYDSKGNADYTWNRAHRYLTTVAYLDGSAPSIIAWRGYYDKTTVTAFNLVDKRLVQIADFNTATYTGANSDKEITGQGNHNTAVGDVDGDGKDEALSGGICLGLDDNGDFTVEWTLETGHGDALHLADYDPTHDGMEYFIVHEHEPYGMSVVYPEDGTIAYHVDNTGDTGRGIMASFNGNGYYQIWGVGTAYKDADGFQGYDASGSLTSKTQNSRIFWDGDLYDELWDGTGTKECWIGIDSGAGSKTGRIMTLETCSTINDTKNNACLQADLLGDWREELVVRNSDSTALLIYTTTISTTEKLYTLMHDCGYRMQVVGQNSAYNQPPHISYYVSPSNDENDMRKYAAYVKTVYNGVESVRTENISKDADGNGESAATEKTLVASWDFEDGDASDFTVSKASLSVEAGTDENTSKILAVTAGGSLNANEIGRVARAELDFSDKVTGAENGVVVEFDAADFTAVSSIRRNYMVVDSGVRETAASGTDVTTGVFYQIGYNGKNFTVNGTAADSVKPSSVWAHVTVEADYINNSVSYTVTDLSGTETYISVKDADCCDTSCSAVTGLEIMDWSAGSVSYIDNIKVYTVNSVATPTPSASPMVTPTVSPTVSPTETPMVTPTVSPTVSPTETPTADSDVTPAESDVTAPTGKITYDRESGAAKFTSALEAEGAAVIFASYDDSGRLISVAVTTVDISRAENVVPAPSGFNGDGEVKIFIWDSITAMTPLEIAI